ncbi:MAG: WD40 repeat domain-containing protein, partial [Armatimonadota bacterium]
MAGGMSAPVHSVAYSPDGTTLATASLDGVMKLWSVTDGSLLRSIVASDGRLLSVAFSGDGSMLASAGEDQVVRLWDAASGKLIRMMKGHSGPVWSVAFSP